ncbi:E2F-associated phosphoprotein isoform X3 [Cyprinodon tularosa]|uniref:E2F-associated phosphoprotein isoform X3 n=1 Tax=Cyprinodon tularosa TaxID=77115 RepID=UPI0018E28937|nr:E2F-associated phosphoprotein isoform X3 [Cyprinodon tularosa]
MNKLNKSEEYDSYEIDEPSDEERAESSSEDELDVLLNGTAEQKKKLIREYLTGESESSSEDEFEKEMEAELSSTIRTMEGTWGPAAVPTGGGGAAGNDGGSGSSNPQMYDQIYFDSDSEEEDKPSSSTDQRRRRRIIPTNDELLYDPDADDRDQAWVDSRRHEKYRTQYRAMFVMNCVVKTDEVLRYKTQQDKNSRKRRRGQKALLSSNRATGPTPAGMEPEEIYHPVKCTECSTEVAVFDKDEVYHFFNILASHC